MWDLFSKGGPVMFGIGAASVVAWIVSFLSWSSLRSKFRAVEGRGGCLCLFAAVGNEACSDATVRAVLEAARREDETLIDLVCVLGSVLPLLGLLGTVWGMLVTVRVIQMHGNGDPRLLADGIKQALLTTQVGLSAAVPVLFVVRGLRSMSRRLYMQMETSLYAECGPKKEMP